MSTARLAAVAGLLLALLTLAFTLTNLLLPAGIYDTEAVLFAAGSHPEIYRVFFGEWALTGVLGLAFVGATTRLLVDRPDGWTDWVSKLAYLAYGVTAVQAIHLFVSLPGLGQLYQGCHTCTASLAEQQTIAKWIYVNLALDPLNFIVVGGLGVWILVVSLQAMSGAVARGVVYVGIAAGVLLIGVVVVGAFDVPLDIPVLVATVAVAVWYAGVGWLLLKKT